MNVSASLRASFYGPNGLLGLPPQSKRDTMAGDVKALRWRSTLVPINYVDYNSYCRQIKEEVNRESISVFFSVLFFVPGGALTLVTGWDADKGIFEPVKLRLRTEDGSTKTYKPALLGSSAWLWIPAIADLKAAAFWSSVGSIGFALTGFALFMEDINTSTIANFVGSWTFLIGSIFQWYDLMAFHPDDWAT
ncbi:uncharacterized protein F4817DRAFT_311430 [Daldinia loculata]|uniref:uncharacterized protein n=1 Tax=Daldinia loculata TaxID=103429 RepID=UPI0020C3D8D4|nr:uncharacterized protein F4817DRAFT_311430 [Daldinia loculata]KAI1651824.1 hypothetical protein F4817DRAFT_311430 [Daldinia loculata]